MSRNSHVFICTNTDSNKHEYSNRIKDIITLIIVELYLRKRGFARIRQLFPTDSNREFFLYKTHLSKVGRMVANNL